MTDIQTEGPCMDTSVAIGGITDAMDPNNNDDDGDDNEDDNDNKSTPLYSKLQGLVVKQL